MSVGVLDAEGVGVVEAALALFLFLLPGPLLLILSEPGLLGGDSLTVGPIVFVELEPILLKCPLLSVGPWIIDGTGATVTAGGGVWWLLLAPLLDVVTTALLDTDVTTDEAVGWDCCCVCGCTCGNAGWLFDDPRFGLRGFSCLSDDWELRK